MQQGLWKKLNLKEQSTIAIINAPEEFSPFYSELKNVSVEDSLITAKQLNFFMIFTKSKADVQHYTDAVIAHTLGDCVVWFAYPKASSKRYSCDFNRDNGWDPLKNIGFSGVRQVAIDEDWSALRFRRTEFIKSKSSS
ncbi:hypothetical protein [Litorilituus lipolyticus]|uniref:DUF3052 domain-containing protein n=1 Tax=Litorilituus lipolyticus TaxID=2491017 RepID=A0A502KY32_9GAMM|nr:hypothetical protein [Litorilituus lipolyticus]TPH16588.1 hypothetical protein EPA86_06335 [Litorilituus lipolyticus]